MCHESHDVSVVVCLSVCVLSLGKKLTRQLEGQKHWYYYIATIDLS